MGGAYLPAGSNVRDQELKVVTILALISTSMYLFTSIRINLFFGQHCIDKLSTKKDSNLTQQISKIVLYGKNMMLIIQII